MCQHGRGVALMCSWNSFVAMVVDVAVDGPTVRVTRVTAAVDCGAVVNPDTVEAQIQGGAIFGITAALYNEITFVDGRVQQSNFHDYPMLRISQSPLVNVHLVASSAEPGGVGEAGTAAIGPAVFNAIFAATGKRLRKWPVANQLLKA